MQIPAADYLRAMRTRRLIQDALKEVFESVDLIASPSTCAPATGIDDALDEPEALHLRSLGNTELSAAGNLAGLPALSLPCGFTSDGLPVGVQLVAKPFNEPVLLAVGRAFQRATGWHLKRPSL